MYIQESDLISLHDCNFIDASINIYSGDDGYSSYNNAQLSIDTCNFYNYVDRNAFKMDTNSETWVFSMNVTNSNFYDNDNDRRSETSALIGFYNTNTNTDIISYARFDTCNFYRNTDLFSIVEDCTGNINNSLSDRKIILLLIIVNFMKMVVQLYIIYLLIDQLQILK